MIEELSPIPRKGRLSSSEILMGTSIPPLDKLQIMSEDEFEVMCLEWATAYLKGKYVKVRQMGGAGDKGRDVIGYYENGAIDVYQCKHYNSALSPSQIYVELGKLCWYTFNNLYPIPNKYYLVTSIPIGPALVAMIEDPSQINKALRDHWNNSCRTKITKKEVIELTAGFADYVDNFDFSIITDKSPLELIEEYKETQYYASRFGGGIQKFRSSIPKASENIDPRELVYVDQLFKVYEQKLSNIIKDQEQLRILSPGDSSHFDEQRNSFYSAESLEVFSRENFPDANPIPFEEIKSDAALVARNTLLLNEEETAYRKLLFVIQEVQRQSFVSNPLHLELRPLDKNGICHHLVNANEIKWI